jgi:hypothetical protein
MLRGHGIFNIIRAGAVFSCVIQLAPVELGRVVAFAPRYPKVAGLGSLSAGHVFRKDAEDNNF